MLQWFILSSSCSWRVRIVILFLNPQDEVGPSTSSFYFSPICFSFYAIITLDHTNSYSVYKLYINITHWVKVHNKFSSWCIIDCKHMYVGLSFYQKVPYKKKRVWNHCHTIGTYHIIITITILILYCCPRVLFFYGSLYIWRFIYVMRAFHLYIKRTL